MRPDKRLLAIVIVIVASVLVVVPPVGSSPVSAAGILNLTKQAPPQVLAGDPITYTLRASNTGDAAFFNVSFRDVLAPGVRYTGPTTPSAAGEPQVITNTVVVSGVSVQQQTLIWSNVTDLQPRSSFSLSFPVDVNTVGAPARPDVHVVGAVIANTGEVYGSTDPRVVPTFSATGAPPSPLPTSVVRTQSSSVSTTLTAVEIVKGSDSAPEGELLRGVHDHKARYTLTVDVTKLGSSSQVVVTDTLPPQLEFLGCGGVDNSTDAGGQRPEYTNAPFLFAGRTLTADPTCIAPSSVETQSDGSTLVTWSGLPTLSNPDQPYVISYLAGIPLFANAAFVSGTAPSPTSRGQASNLDNNTGASTRELAGSEAAATNRTRVDGRYDNAGLLEPGAPVNQFDTDELTRTIEDVRIRKETLAPVSGVFDIGQIARYRVTVETSEYMTASNVVLTDTIPNGMCPLVQSGFTGYPTIVPAADATGCAQPGAPTQPIQSVTARPAGGFDVVFTPIAPPPTAPVPVNGRVQVEYSAYMRSTYQGGAFNGQPTVSGDSFTNSVASVATTTGRPFLPPAVSGPLPGVTDGSSDTLTTGSANIFKDLLPRDVTPRLSATVPAGSRCPDSTTGTGADQYIPANSPPTAADVPKLGFRIGDQICFRLRVNFDAGVQTRNAIVSDFVPVGTKLVAGSIRNTSRNNVSSTVTSSPSEGPIEWRIGTPTDGVDVVDDQNRVFEVVFAVEVTTVAPTDTPVLTGNLMKMRTENSLGQAQSFRDVANFGIVPAPPVRVIKGVESIDVPLTGPNAANSNVDGSTVQQASQVRFRIDLTNLGEQRTFDAFSVRRVEVLDVLPVQVRCASIAAITNFGTVTNLGRCIDPGQTVGGFTNTSTTQSMIRWAFDESDAYALFPAGEPLPAPPNGAESGTRSLFYTMTIPSTTSVSTRFDNTAGVRTYGAFTNLQGQTSPNYIPANNIDPSLNSQANAEPARDTSWVITRSATVGKFVTSWISETNNNYSTATPAPTAALPIVNTLAQAVVGEYVTYRYFVDVPAQTTVFNASLTDQLPASNNGAFVIVADPPPASGAPAASAGFYAVAGSGSPAALPGGFTFTRTDGALAFPATYTNSTTTAQRFEVVISARVADTQLGPTDEPTRTNTARFNSNGALGGPALTAVTSAARVQIRQPVPSLTKRASETSDAALPAGNIVAAGQTVKYTLTATNTSGRPPLHDSWLVDCVPSGLGTVTILAPQAGDVGPVPGTGTAGNGCATTETYLAFKIGSLAGGASVARQYTAVVSTQSVGGAVYPNTARLTGSSLNNGKDTPQSPNDATERAYSTTASESVRVLGASLDKTVTPGQATIGEDVEFTLRVDVPANTNLYQAAVVDRLPLGYTLRSPLAPVVSCVFAGTSDPCGAPTLQSVLGPTNDLTPTPPARSAQVIAFSFGDVLSNARARVVTIRYPATVSKADANVQGGPPLVNTAQARWDLVDTNTVPTTPLYPWTAGGNTDDATVTVIEPKLTIAKSTPDLTIEPGQEFTYSIRVQNTGGSTAYNTVITDTIPAGIELVPGTVASPSPDQGGTVSGKTITWNIPSGSLDPTEFVTLTYKAKLVASTGISAATPVASFTNNAQVTRYTSRPTVADPNGRVYAGPNSNVVIAPQFPRLTTAKSQITADPAYIGEPVTWEIVTTNQTPGGTAFATTISDTLPPNWTFGSTTSITGPGGAITPVPAPTVTPSPTGDTLVWTLGTLAPGQNYTVVFTATPQLSVDVPPALPATFTNRTTSTATDGSGSPGNQAGPYTAPSSATARIDRVDLAIDKSHTAAPIAGSDFSWSIVVRNNGPSQAVGPFNVTDQIPTLPAGVTFASAGGTGWSCTPATGPASPPTTGTVTCSRTGTLDSGAAFEPIAFTVRIPSDTPDGTRISNTARVSGQRTYERPTDLANNTDTDEAIITTRADLQVVKTLDAPLVAGRNGTYTLVVTNNGPSVSRATVSRPIIVTDTLPAGSTFVSASSGCTHAAGIVTCQRTTDIAVTGTWTNSITIAVPASALGQFRNVAVVTPDITLDPISGNNTSIVTSEVGTNADLVIVKTHTGASTPGRPTTFNLRVTNFGTSDAATVTIVDTLPAGMTYRAFSNVRGNWSCQVTTAPQFRCQLLPTSLPLRFTGVPATDNVEVQIEVDTAANLTGQTVRNTAVVSSTTPDSNSLNNTSSADVTFAGVADLALTKTSSGTAVPGGDVTWTITVTNLGPSDSLNPITVTDALPAGMSRFVSAAGVVPGDGWVCDPINLINPNVRCVKGSRLAAGASTLLTVVGTTNPAVGGPAQITNSATVTPTTPEGPNATGNNTGTNVVTLVEPDVAIAKAVSNATPQPGDTFTYTVTLTNAANRPPAYNLVVTDDVPDGVAVGTISSGGVLTGTTLVGGVPVGGTITWTIPGPLAAGSPLVRTYTARLAPSSSINPTPQVNTASLDRYESLPTGGRPYAGGTATATITPRFPALTIAKEALGDNPTYIGDEFGWRITVTNSGQGDAALVRLADVLPPNWTFVAGSAVVTAPGPVVTPQPTVSSVSPPAVQTLTWSNLGPLAAAQSLTVTIRTIPGPLVVTAPGVGSGTPHVNSAQAGAEDPTGATGNRDGSYSSPRTTAQAFIHSADVRVVKTNAVDVNGNQIPAVAGRNHTWTIAVSNVGPDTAVGPFVVRDALPVLSPDPLVFVSAAGTGWSCTQAAGVVTCNRTNPGDTLSSGGSFEPISITVRIPSDYLTPPIQNTATVSAKTFDPNLTNNTSTVPTPVGGVADLQLVKTRGSQTVVAGEPLTYFLDLTNLGPSTSRATITVTDTLPPQVRFRSAPTAPTSPADPWDCVVSPVGATSGGTVTCTFAGNLPANGVAPQIPIIVDVLPGADPDVEIVNTAVVASTGTTDPVPGNNTSESRFRPNALADLAIDKDAQGPLIAGQTAVYRMRVVNNGPSDAEATVRITDDLPAGLTFVGFADEVGTWSCRVTTAPQFTCDLAGPLAARGEVVVDVTVAVASGVSGTIVNTASVASPTTDPFLDNNTDSDSSPFGTLADLAIVKSTAASPVKAGENVTWNLSVTNNGPSDSQPVIRVVDLLPSTVEFVSAGGTGWDCPPPAPSANPVYSGVLTCTRAAVLEAKTPGDPGATNHIAPTITLVARVRPDAGPGFIVNGAIVLPGATDDGNPSNNFSLAPVEVIDDVDVGIVKTAAPSTVRAGETTTYTLRVSNAGPSTADDIVVTDVMPSGVRIETLTATGWTCPLSTPVEFRCELDSLAPSATQTITVLARVGSGVPNGTVLANTAFVDTSSPDRNPSNDSSRADITIVADADLAITKVHPVDPAAPIVAGGSVEFRIDVVNNGPSDAVKVGTTPAVTVEDRLPDGFSFVSARGPWDCRVRTGTDPQIIDCDYESDVLIAGDSAPALFLTAAIDSTLDANVYNNVAVVDSATLDSNQTNNSATDPVVVGTLADLTIVKSHDADAVRIGENLVFTLQVSNLGPSEARNVVVTDIVPAGLTLVGAAGQGSSSGWNCSATAAPDVSCALTDPLAAGVDAEPLLVTVLVTPQAFPSVENTAVVTSDTAEPDPDPNPNSSTDEVLVPALVDLAIVKTHAGEAAIGSPLVYTLEVTNRGPIADSNVVTVTDVLPSGLTPVSATSTDPDVTCGITGQTVSCERDGLGVDETFRITLTANVLPSAYPLVVNTATVGSATDDRDPLNNTSSDPANVPPLVDLAITKTHTGTIQVGGRITYTVTVRNNGPTPDPGPVSMLDTLPGSLTPVSATADGMTCTITGQAVACQALAPLAVNAQLVITIVADVGPAAFPSVSNTAIVTTPGCSVGPSTVSQPGCPDTDLTNNQATDVAQVAPLVLLQLTKTLASQAGLNATWNFVVANVGLNATTQPIVLTDALPSGLVYVSAQGAGWACTNASNVVTCTYPAAVAAGATAAPLQIVTLVTARGGTEIVNVATVIGGGPGVPSVTDAAPVTSPPGANLPSTGGGGVSLLQLGMMLGLFGVLLLVVSRLRRPRRVAT